MTDQTIHDAEEAAARRALEVARDAISDLMPMSKDNRSEWFLLFALRDYVASINPASFRTDTSARAHEQA